MRKRPCGKTGSGARRLGSALAVLDGEACEADMHASVRHVARCDACLRFVVGGRDDASAPLEARHRSVIRPSPPLRTLGASERRKAMKTKLITLTVGLVLTVAAVGGSAAAAASACPERAACQAGKRPAPQRRVSFELVSPAPEHAAQRHTPSSSTEGERRPCVEASGPVKEGGVRRHPSFRFSCCSVHSLSHTWRPVARRPATTSTDSCRSPGGEPPGTDCADTSWPAVYRNGDPRPGGRRRDALGAARPRAVTLSGSVDALATEAEDSPCELMIRPTALLAAIAASLLAVSGASGADAQTPKRGGTLVFRLPGPEPACLNVLAESCIQWGLLSWIDKVLQKPSRSVPTTRTRNASSRGSTTRGSDRSR